MELTHTDLHSFGPNIHTEVEFTTPPEDPPMNSHRLVRVGRFCKDTIVLDVRTVIMKNGDGQ